VQKLKKRKWSVSKNSRIWKTRSPPIDRMNLLVQAPHEEESEEYSILIQSPNCNEDGRLENNREDQYSHKKILGNGNWDVIKNLEEQFNESIYLSA
jgi:hypothetical protein